MYVYLPMGFVHGRGSIGRCATFRMSPVMKEKQLEKLLKEMFRKKIQNKHILYCNSNRKITLTPSKGEVNDFIVKLFTILKTDPKNDK